MSFRLNEFKNLFNIPPDTFVHYGMYDHFI